MSQEKALAIGIDIGNNYSRVGVFKDGELHIVADKQGKKFIPSCVAFTDSEILVGDKALAHFTRNPDSTVIAGIKTLIGRYFDNTTDKARTMFSLFIIDEGANNFTDRYFCDLRGEACRRYPFAFTNENGETQIKVHYKREERIFYPEEVIAILILELKEMAEIHLGSSVKEAVISVPNGFDRLQRQLIKDATSIAGLHVLRLVNDSAAAAIAYDHTTRKTSEYNLLVFSWGGSSLNISVLTNADHTLEVKSYCSDMRLGGDDLQNRMFDCLAQQYTRKYRRDLHNVAVQRLLAACNGAKQLLSFTSETTIAIVDPRECVNLPASSISRDRFEEMCADLFRSVLEPIEKALRDAKLDKTQIDNVVLTGGSTKIPKIQSLLREFFNGKELDILDDDAVVNGLALQAAKLSGDQHEILQNFLLLDALPLSLGVETNGGVMKVILAKNTTIPATQTAIIKINNVDAVNPFNNDRLWIRIYEGESAIVKDNKLLGNLTFHDNVMLTRKGPREIEIIFDVCGNGVLRVTALNRSTNNEEEIKISYRIHLGKDRMDRTREEFVKAKTHEAMLRLKDHCAKVKSSVKDILDKCVEIDEGINNHEIDGLSECKRRRVELDSLMKNFFDNQSSA